MRARIAVAVALVMGIGIGGVVAPRLVDRAQARGEHAYRCVGDNGADGGIQIFLSNLTGSPNRVEIVRRDQSGADIRDDAFILDPHATTGPYLVTSASALIEITGAGKLAVDGWAKYLNGADPDTIRQINCT